MNQDDARRENTPPGLYKLEWNRIFGPSLYLNAKAAYHGNGFGVTPRGGLDRPGTLDFTNRTAFGSSFQFRALSPQTTLRLDGNYFRAGLGGNHEFKFGFGYRHAPVDSITQYAGRMWGLYFGGGGLVSVYRDRVASFESRYWHAYLSDTLSRGRLTLNLGLRLDRQSANNRPAEVPANPDFPELLPAIRFDGRGAGVDWDDLSPRVGLSYALDDARRTVVRASYARYAGQLSSYDGSWDSPVSTVSYLQYYWDDHNGDRVPQRDEVLTGAGVYYAYNVDPADPGSVSAVNRIDPDYRDQHDREAVVGFERELLPNLAVGVAYTYRNTTDVYWLPRNGVTRQDYTRSATVTRTTPLGAFAGTAFGADLSMVQPGRTLTSQPDYHRRFNGLELSLNKRLADRWMARVAFSYNDWVERFEGGVERSRGVQDPTRLEAINFFGGGPLVDGGQVALGGKHAHFSSVKWQLTGNALRELPWGLEVAAALFARQGHPRPTFITMTVPGEPAKEVLAEARVDTRRYPDLWNLDLRLAKNVRVGAASLVLSAEAFNLIQ